MDWLSKVKIRYLTQADLPELEWEGEYTRFRRVYADAYKQAKNGRAVLWVIDLPGVSIIGQLFVSLFSNRSELANGFSRAYIYSVRVRPEYRSCGLGTILMRTAEADLKRRCFEWATLNVARDNYRGRQFYERLGYQVVAPEAGRWSYRDENGIKRDVVEPAWRMEKYIGD
jgi:ribosomal protein S18 acetylase RimI-like enzyme